MRSPGSPCECSPGPSAVFLPGVGSGAAEYDAQGLSLAGCIVLVGLRLMAKPAPHPDDGDGGVGQAGEVTGQFAGASRLRSSS